jgi:hypothetical protein
MSRGTPSWSVDWHFVTRAVDGISRVIEAFDWLTNQQDDHDNYKQGEKQTASAVRVGLAFFAFCDCVSQFPK